VQDRLTNAATGFATFAAMGGTAKALDGLGTFAVPEARSLAGSMTYGGISGAAGGVVNAEANALKDGHVVPSLDNLAKNTATYAAFGLAYGAAGYEANKLTAPPPTKFTTNQNSAEVTHDSNGNPVKAVMNLSEVNNPSIPIQVTAAKMTDGTWGTSIRANISSPVNASDVTDVKISGKTLAVSSDDNSVRQFTDGADYKKVDLRGTK
jgi:hypothetical protein